MLEDVKGRRVVILVAGVRGMSDSAGLTFRCVLAVCGPRSALRCQCACPFRAYCGGAIKSLHSSTWLYDSET